MTGGDWVKVTAVGLWGLVWAWGGCSGRPVEAGDAAVWDSEPAGEWRPVEAEAGLEASVEEAGPRDAALEKPEYDETWCHVQIMPEEDPNAECIPGTGEYENLGWSWDGGRWVAQSEVRNGRPWLVVYDMEDATFFLLGDPSRYPVAPLVRGGRLAYCDCEPGSCDVQFIHEYDLESRRELRTVAVTDVDPLIILPPTTRPMW